MKKEPRFFNAVRSRSLKLRSMVLQRLIRGADGVVKIEYLRRDLVRTAARRVDPRSGGRCSVQS